MGEGGLIDHRIGWPSLRSYVLSWTKTQADGITQNRAASLELPARCTGGLRNVCSKPGIEPGESD